MKNKLEKVIYRPIVEIVTNQIKITFPTLFHDQLDFKSTIMNTTIITILPFLMHKHSQLSTCIIIWAQQSTD